MSGLVILMSYSLTMCKMQFQYVVEVVFQYPNKIKNSSLGRKDLIKLAHLFGIDQKGT